MSSGDSQAVRFVEPQPIDPQFGKFSVTGTPSRSSRSASVQVVRLHQFTIPPPDKADPSLVHIHTFQLDDYATSPETVTRRSAPKATRSHRSPSPAFPLSRTVSQNALVLFDVCNPSLATLIPTQQRSRKRRYDENVPPDDYTLPALGSPSPAPAHYTSIHMAPFPVASFHPPYPILPQHLAHGALPHGSTSCCSPEVSDTRRKGIGYHSEKEKLSMILNFIYDEVGWTLGDFMHASFDHD
ncbi:hypothetical protein LXA43DRAFT_1052881 [Ganoderma leucocontextum]|nr:hypothetical protein LXA43DRAFT_1052881 [Ganoderma leucocontextum]